MKAQEAKEIYRSALMKEIEPFLNEEVYPAIKKAAEDGKRELRISADKLFNKKSSYDCGLYGELSEKKQNTVNFLIQLLEEYGYRVQDASFHKSVHLVIFW